MKRHTEADASEEDGQGESSAAILNSTNPAYSGRLYADAGTVAVTGTASVGAITIGAVGTVDVGSGATLTTTTGVDVSTGGLLTGTGTVGGVVSNTGGDVAPGASAGLLTVDGDYTQGASGTLQIEIGGTTSGTEYDKLVVTGTAFLAGTLDISLIGGFEPQMGNNFEILTAATVSGTFDTVLGTSLPSGDTLTVIYSPTAVTLTVSGGNHLPVAGDWPAGAALDFNGINQYVTTDNALDFATGDYTVSGWFKTDTNDAHRDILAATGYPPTGDEHGILIELRTDNTVRYLHRFPVGASGGTNIYSSLPYSVGVWHHFAAVKSGSTMTLYLDGDDAGSATDSSAAVGSLYVTLGRLGRAIDSRYLDGQLDDIRIWNVARSQPDIQADMNTELNGDEPGLVGYWQLNEGTGLTAYDATASGVDGTLFGAPQWAVPSEAMDGTDQLTDATYDVVPLTVTLAGRDLDGDPLQAIVTALPLAGTGDLHQ